MPFLAIRPFAGLTGQGLRAAMASAKAAKGRRSRYELLLACHPARYGGGSEVYQFSSRISW